MTRRKNPSAPVKAGAVLASPAVWAAFIGFRLYVRQETIRHIMAYYRENPRVVGPVLYTLIHQTVQVGSVGEPAAKKLARKMARALVPMFSLNIPTEESVKAYLAGKARQLLGIKL